MTDPLAGLDDVPWHQLHHAFGTAGDVPDRLRDLRSPDEQTRANARRRLFGTIYHQGTRWQSSAHAVPFLVALIDDAGTPERGSLVQLLAAVGLGDVRDEDLPFDADEAFALADDVTDEHEAMLIEALYDEDRDLDDVPQEVVASVDVMFSRNAYRAVGGYLRTYQSWLDDPDGEVAARAAELLAWFPMDETTVRALMRDSRPVQVRASANLTLGHLTLVSDAIDAHLRSEVASDGWIVRATAAVALAYRLGRSLPDAAIDVLTEPWPAAPTGRLASSPDAVASVPGWSRSLDGFRSLALARASA
jgi:hypothetical protein